MAWWSTHSGDDDMLYFSKQRCFLFVSASIIWDDAIARRQRNTQFAHSIVYISAYLSLYHTTRHFSTDRKKNTTRMTMWCWEIYMLIMEFALTGPLWLLSVDCGFALTCFGQKCSLIFCFVGVFLSSFLHMSINMGHLWYERMTNGSHIHQNMDDEIRLFRR